MTIPNEAPPSADDFMFQVEALKLDADNLPEINADTAPKVRDLLGRVTEMAKKIEAGRKAAKEPHLEAGRRVDAEFKPLTDTLAALKDAINRPLAAWLKAEQDRQRAEAEAARKAAEEAAAFQEAMADDEDMAAKAKAFAEKRQIEADLKQAQAEGSGRVQSASGFTRAAGLRTYRSAEITDAAALVAHFASHPDVVDAALKAANAAIHAAKGGEVNIPGVRVVEEQKVA